MRCRYLHSDNGDGKCNFLKFTGDAVARSEMSRVITRARSERSVDLAGAFLDALPGQHGNGNHSTDEADVENHGHEGEEGHSSNAAGENGAEQSVERGRARHTLNGSHPLRDRGIIMGQRRQEIRENAEDHGRVEELEDSDGEVEKSENHAAKSHLDGYSLVYRVWPESRGVVVVVCVCVW